jgi:hypothetical protein
MMVGRMLSNITGQLSHLYLSCKVPLEAGEQYFSLGGFEPVHNRRNGSNVVLIREVN